MTLKKKQIAVQMFTFREEAKNDFTGTLRKVANIGYDGVEFAGYGGLHAMELKNVLDDLGLKAASSHVRLPELENNLEREIETQLILGNKHIVLPFLPPERRNKEDYRNLIPFMNRVGERCHENGITFSYHNHDFELIPFDDGTKPLDYLLQETNPEWVQTELDVYWLTRIGENPVEWLKRYHNRTPLIHLKDMTTDGEKFFAELGTGGVDLEGVINQASQSNVEWWIVEQDRSKRSPFESVQISLDFLKNKIYTIN